MITTEKQKIGTGAHWNVERWFLENPIEESGILHKTIIVKRSLNGDIDSNVSIYQRILETGLPTLSFFRPNIIEEERVIITEDLNASNTVYLSPNSGRQIMSETDEIVRVIRKYLNQQPLISDDNVVFKNQIERIWKDNKIEHLNFDYSFFEMIDNDMERASRFGLGMCEDAFFFGYDSDLNIIKDYKIADFDAISTGRLEFSMDLVYRNSFVMLNSLWEYFDNFVESTGENISIKSEIERRIQIKSDNIA